MTDEERRTGTYSNRFAAHILRQHQFHALCALHDDREGVRLAAAEVLGSVGPAAARPEILAALAPWLRDPDWHVRSSGVRVVGRLQSAVTPEFLRILAEKLRDPHAGVRLAAAEVLGSVGPAAARPGVLDALPRLLRDPIQKVRLAATKAVGELGPEAATPEVLAALPRLLRDANGLVRMAAAATVSRMGPAAVTPELLTTLARLLRDPSRSDRALGAKALQLITRHGFRLLFGRRWFRRPKVIPRTVGALAGEGTPVPQAGAR